MDEVWKLVYESFEGGSDGAWKTVTASNTMRNELQFRLHNQIAEYKKNPSKKLCEQIAADVQLAESLGYMSRETTAIILDRLAELR